MLIENNSKDICISTNTNRLICEEKKLKDVVEKKLTNEQILKEKNFNNNKREPVVIVSPFFCYKCETHKKMKLKKYNFFLSMRLMIYRPRCLFTQ